MVKMFKDMCLLKYRPVYMLLAFVFAIFGGAQAQAQNAPLQIVGQNGGYQQGNMDASQQNASSRPVLMISNNPVPKSILQKAYSYPSKSTEISPAEVVGSAYYKPTETMVTRKLRDLKGELAILQDKVVLLSQALARLQKENEARTAEYFAAVATINTQLQVGTTPGNPRLLKKYTVAEQALEALGGRLIDFNNLSIDASKVATEASFLLDSARATYGLSGAVEEDHVNLAEMEDKINTMIVLVERILSTVGEDISRTRSYMSSERDNLRKLSVAVANGSLYGVALADRPFSGVRNISHLAASLPQQNSSVPPGYQMPVSQQGNMVAPPPPPGFFEAMQQQGLFLPSAMPAPAPAPQPVNNFSQPYMPPQPMASPQAVAPVPPSVAMQEPRALSQGVIGKSQSVQPTPLPAASQGASSGNGEAEPLVKIKFAKSDVDYEQPLLAAVNEVLDRYPEASFSVVALHSSAGGAAANAIESTRSRRNAQKVTRSLTQVGVPADRIEVSYEADPDLDANEVHLYIY